MEPNDLFAELAAIGAIEPQPLVPDAVVEDEPVVEEEPAVAAEAAPVEPEQTSAAEPELEAILKEFTDRLMEFMARHTMK